MKTTAFFHLTACVGGVIQLLAIVDGPYATWRIGGRTWKIRHDGGHRR